MSKAILIALVFSIVVPTASYGNGAESRAAAKRTRSERIAPIQTQPISRDIVRVPRGLLSTAAPDTAWLGVWDFDGAGGVCAAQGWVSVDRTEQTGVYWHVDDFAGLGGGDFGRLVPLGGAQSLWCGARPLPATSVLCHYATLPGYGNDWDQQFSTVDCLAVEGTVTVEFAIAWDSEPIYDWTTLEYDLCDDDWVGLYGGAGVWEGVGSDTLSIAVTDTLQSGSLRLRFRFTSDPIWSDEDGDWDTDGAVIIDDLTVSDSTGVVLPTETFEAESVGDTATVSGNWKVGVMPGYGDFAGLYDGLSVVQEDVCYQNASCLWGFFSGSPYDYACGGFPAQAAVPYENLRGQYLSNEIWSPVMPFVGTGSNIEFAFDIYRDLKLDALIFYRWRVRSWSNGCPGPWKNDGFVHHEGPQKAWDVHKLHISQYIDAGADSIQVALGAADMCWRFGGIYGNCTCHSHAPLFDNIRLYRVDSNGPVWMVDSWALFQDNFSADGSRSGAVRADMAIDILPRNYDRVQPGDSVVVGIIDPESGLGCHVVGDPSSGPAAYCYVSVDGLNEAVIGAALVDDPRYSVAGTQAIYGRTWTKIQMDSCYDAVGSVVPDRFNVDLNDALFVPGDTVWFFFGASGGLPASETNYWSEFTGTTDDIIEVATAPMEFTCLPAAGLWRGGDLLYVDGADGTGAQAAFDAAFRMLGLDYFADRYDVRAPGAEAENGPASRVVDVHEQILGVYGRIIWNTGALRTGPDTGVFGDPDDFQLLLTFVRNLSGPGGLYLNGDAFAEYWHIEGAGGSGGPSLRDEYCNFSYGGNLGGNPHPRPEISPPVIGEPGSLFFTDVPDSLIAYGGCPDIRYLDEVDAAGLSDQAMSYYYAGAGRGAVVSQITVNLVGDTVGVVLSGFSFDAVRDDRPARVADPVVHLDRILKWLGSRIVIGVEDENPLFENTLSQNHPNPFNPTTTIAYSIDGRAEVHMAIYNVSGQLVRTLVNGVQEPGILHKVTWDGSNNAGQGVASGVYFYRLVTKNFTRTKKMVLLK